MKQVHKFNLFLTALFLIHCHGLGISEEFERQYRFDRIYLTSELNRVSIPCVEQDDTGFIWVGTTKGIVKFDGINAHFFKYDFQKTTGATRNIFVLHSTDNSIWISMDDGTIVRFDTRTSEFHQYTVNGSQAGVSKLLLIEFMQNDNELKAITSNGSIARFDSNQDQFEIETETLHFHQDPNSRKLLLAQDSKGILYLFGKDDVQFEIDVDNQNASIIDQPNVTDADLFWSESYLLKNGENGYWLIVPSSGVFKINLGVRTISPVQIKGLSEVISSGAFITASLISNEGNLWIGTSSSGIFVFNSENGLSEHLLNNVDDEKSLLSDNVENLFRDKSGVIWVGTSTGLCKYSNYKYKFMANRSAKLFLDEHENLAVNAIVKDKQDTLWVGTQNQGLLKRDSGSTSFAQFRLAQDVENQSITITSILESVSGKLYVGTTRKGLWQILPGENSATRLTDEIAIAHVYEDSGSRIWVAAIIEGIGELDSATNEISYWKPPINPEKNIDTFDPRVFMKDAQNNLWIGSDNGGLLKLHPDRKTYEHYVVDPGNNLGLSDNRVVALHEDEDNNLWIGTLNGLNKFDTERNVISHLFVEDGLPDNVICAIGPGTNGDLWLSTYKGLVRFDTNTESCFTYDHSTGLNNVEYIPGAVTKDDDGNVYFGGRNGFDVINMNNVAYASVQPQIVLTSVKVLSQELQYEKASNQRDFEFNYDKSSLEFSFAVLDFNNIERNRFSYRLAGLQDDWIDTGFTTSISYPLVPPGRYTFEVKGFSSDGMVTGNIARFPFNVNPPYWNTWQFRGLIAVFFLLLIFAIYKIRTHAIKSHRKQLILEVNERRVAEGSLLANQARLRSLAAKLTLAEEKERHRLSVALHDSIGHALIASKLKLLNVLKVNKDEFVVKSVDSVINGLDSAIKYSRHLTSTISPPSLYKYGFETAAEGLLERFSAENKIKSVTSFETKNKPSEEVSILLYQILREVLMNVLKHAEASSIKVSIHEKDNLIHVSVEDDGVGFDPKPFQDADDKIEGFGLYSINERLESIGGELLVQSAPGKGTTIEIMAPLDLA